LSHLYSASHHNRIKLKFFFRALFGPDPRWSVYTSTGLYAGINFSLAMIQKDYAAYVAASLGEELLSGRFSHEAVSYIVRVEVKSGHRPVRSNAPDLAEARARARKVELNDGAVPITHKA
jgi:transcriptional regulator GlxA family with amidase domain